MGMVDDLITSILLRSILRLFKLTKDCLSSPYRPWWVMNLETELLHADEDGFVIMKTFSSWKSFFEIFPNGKYFFSCVDQARLWLCRHIHTHVWRTGELSAYAPCYQCGRNSCVDNCREKLCAGTNENIKEGRRRRNWSVATKFTLGQTRAMCQRTSRANTGQRRAAFSRTNAQEGVTGVRILASFFFMANLCQ